MRQPQGKSRLSRNELPSLSLLIYTRWERSDTRHCTKCWLMLTLSGRNLQAGNCNLSVIQTDTAAWMDWWDQIMCKAATVDRNLLFSRLFCNGIRGGLWWLCPSEVNISWIAEDLPSRECSYLLYMFRRTYEHYSPLKHIVYRLIAIWDPSSNTAITGQIYFHKAFHRQRGDIFNNI